MTQAVSRTERKPAWKLRPLRELLLALETPQTKGNKCKSVIFLGPTLSCYITTGEKSHEDMQEYYKTRNRPVYGF